MLDNKTIFNKFYAKLRLEAIIKSLIMGLIFGLIASFASAFVAFLLIRDGLLVSILVFVVATAVATVIFYFKRFKPTAKMIAHRVDRLGLEERLVTMLELENDPSYVAMVQREDARDKLSKANPAHLKMKFAMIPLIAVGVLLVLSTAMIVISNRFANDKSAWNPLLSGRLEGKIFEVTYEAGEGGVISGETIQFIEFGQRGEKVIAVANPGYVFDYWSDELKVAERQEEYLTDNLKLVAVFVPVETGEEPGDGEASHEESEEDPRYEPSDQEGEKKEGTPGADPDSQGGDGAGGEKDDTNKIIDGEIDYRAVYAEYLDRARAMLDEGIDIPDEIREIIEAYFGIII